MKKLAAILMIGVLHAVFAGAQTDSSVHVKAFPGYDVGTKIANAMLTCPAGPIQCYLIIDASLATTNPGTVPSLCSNCQLVDYRTTLPGGASYPGISLQFNRPIQSSTLPSYVLNGTWTDPCSKIAGGIATDFLVNNVLGNVYGESTAPTASPVHCGPYAFFPPPITTPGPGLPNGTGGTVYPAPGVTHYLQNELDVPWAWNLECQEKFGGTFAIGSNGQSCLFEPDTTFAAHVLGTPTALGNLGCPLGTSGACFSLGSSLRYDNFNCEGNPFLWATANFYTQQGATITGNSVSNCPGGALVLGSSGTAGGSQNQGAVSGNIWTYAAPSANLEMTGYDIASAGSGYATGTTVNVAGCTIAPSYGVSLSGGTVVGLYPIGQNPGGNCPTASAVVVTLTNTGGGTGAVIYPQISNFAPQPLLQSQSTSGGVLFETNSAVAGASSIPMIFGKEIESNSNVVINDYDESPQIFGIAVDQTNNSGTFGNTFIGTRCNGASRPLLACIGIGGGQGSRINSFAALETNSGTGTGVQIINGLLNPQFVISSFPDTDSEGNNGIAGLIMQTSNGTTLSTEREATTTINSGQQFWNCGTGGCTSTTEPHQYMPVWLVNGALQAGISSTTGLPVGIANNGIFTTDYTKKTAAAMNNSIEPLILDGTTDTIGDCVVLSTTALTPIEGHDSSSATCPAGQVHLGTIVDDKTGGQNSIPSTPSAPTLAVVGTAGTRTVQYKAVVNDFANDATVSIPSTAASLSTAPNGLGGTNGVGFSGLPSGLETLIYRTSSGDASLPAGTFYPDANGKASYYSIATASGPDALFPPTLVFSGGGCSTEPTGKAIVLGGSWTGVDIITPGAGCTSNGTITATASTYETGLVHRTNGSTTWTDTGAPGDNTTPSSTGVLGPNIFVNIGVGSVPTFGLATLASGTVTVSTAAACTPSATCVYNLTRCVANASTGAGVPSVGTVSAGTSFVINAESSTLTVVTGDLASVCWRIN